MIFDEIERDLDGPKTATETAFGYLNRSNRRAAAEVRDTLESWVSRYPQEERPALIARLRSPIDDAHVSAFFELALHEWLIRTGHKILEIEPRLDHTPRSPDFLVEAPDGERFFLEATVATGKTRAERAEDARLNSAIHAVEWANAPGHFLDLDVEGKPAAPVTLRRLRRELAAWIGTLPEGPAACNAPPFVYSEHGMTFVVSAVPRGTRLDRPGRAVGARSLEARWATPGDGVREAVAKKATRYGDLQTPYIVAVNMMGEYHEEEDAIDALFGSPCVIVRTSGDGAIERREGRNDDGVWQGRRRPRKRGLSAVLALAQFRPWSAGQVRGVLIRNPWATHPLPMIPAGIDQINVSDGRLRRTDGEALAEILGLPSGWPAHDEQ